MAYGHCDMGFAYNSMRCGARGAMSREEKRDL
jgi:hypothetical protein